MEASAMTGSVAPDSGKDVGTDSGADAEVADVGDADVGPDANALDGGEDATMPDEEVQDGGEDANDGGCVPECTNAVCGHDDGCGNKCDGTCVGSQDICNPQTFVCECQPACSGDSCGHDDGCGVSKRCEVCASPSQYCDTRIWKCLDQCSQPCTSDANCDKWCTGGSYICQNNFCVALHTRLRQKILRR